MGFFSHRQKNVEVRPEQKWDYITLGDFKSTSCFAPLAYGYLYFSLLLSTVVYALDTFTAINLLVFNKWSSEISPTISFTAAKWIFSICIILSFVNLAYEHVRAQLIMRRGSVAECFLDNLAARLECIRWGKGQGWKRFLVFASLTKSKKGAEYVALFTYFSFQSWIRVVLCSGPRQAINALTLYSVYVAKLSATGDNVGNTLLNFFENIRKLAEENYQQALILSAMLFTLIIWIFSFLSLLLAANFFVFYLWSYIPKSDGGLSAYCSRKVSKRLMQIVATKVNAALEDEERRRHKVELKAAKKAGELPPTQLTATIPKLEDDKLAYMPSIQRNDTMASLPAYTSRPGTPGGFELSAIDQKRPLPSRSGTMASVPPPGTSYSTRAPLLGFAAEPGMSNIRSASPSPFIPRLPEIGDSSLGNFGNFDKFDADYPPPPMRTGTASSSRGFGGALGAPPMQLNRANTNDSMGFGLNGSVDNVSGGAYTSSPAMYPAEKMPSLPQRVQSPAPYANIQQRSQSPGTYTNMNQRSQPPAQPYEYQPYQPYQPNQPNQSHHRPTGSESSIIDAYHDGPGRSSPVSSMRSLGPAGHDRANGTPGPYGGLTAPNGFNNNDFHGLSRGMPSPMRSATGPVRSQTPQGSGQPPFAPQRNMTAPVQPFSHQRQESDESYASYFELPAPVPAQQPPPSRPAYENNVWNNDVESQRGPGRY